MADDRRGGIARDDAERSKVLMITYAFPPAAYVGVYRTLKYCKYLQQYRLDPARADDRSGQRGLPG